MSLLSLGFLLVCLPTALLDFVSAKWAAEPTFDVQDAYKWLFQATRGGEHAAPSRQAASAWLDREWSGLKSGPVDEKLWEPLCPGGEIGRLNLRPFQAQGGESDQLLDAFIASSRQYRPDQKVFSAAWAELGRRLKQKNIGGLGYADWKAFDAEMNKKGYPAVHHSREYHESRLPAYRIITSDEYKRLIIKMKGRHMDDPSDP
jgi:hypothetical protein